MMALFMVLWLTSQDEKIKEAVERAFRNPFSSVTKESTGIIPANDKSMQAVKSTTGNFDSASAVELTMLRRINQDLVKSLQSDGEDQGDSSVKLELTPEGLLINVFDRSHKPIFEPQSTAFTTYGDWVFSTLAWEISASPPSPLSWRATPRAATPPSGLTTAIGKSPPTAPPPSAASLSSTALPAPKSKKSPASAPPFPCPTRTHQRNQPARQRLPERQSQQTLTNPCLIYLYPSHPPHPSLGIHVRARRCQGSR